MIIVLGVICGIAFTYDVVLFAKALKRSRRSKRRGGGGGGDAKLKYGEYVAAQSYVGSHLMLVADGDRPLRPYAESRNMIFKANVGEDRNANGRLHPHPHPRPYLYPHFHPHSRSHPHLTSHNSDTATYSKPHRVHQNNHFREHDCTTS